MAAVSCHRHITPLNLVLTLSSCLNCVQIEFNSCFYCLLYQIKAPIRNKKIISISSQDDVLYTLEFLA